MRLTMQHAVRYAYIAKVLNDLSAGQPVRIYNDEPEPVCEQCGGPLVPGTRHCRHCVSKTGALPEADGRCQGVLATADAGFCVVDHGIGPFPARSRLSKIAGQRRFAAPAGRGPDMTLFAIGIGGLVVELVGGHSLMILRGRLMTVVSSSISFCS